jgi:hypothetical protein
MLVLSVGFDDTAQEAARQELVFGGVEEAEELLMTMLLHGAAEDHAIEYVEGGG